MVGNKGWTGTSEALEVDGGGLAERQKNRQMSYRSRKKDQGVIIGPEGRLCICISQGKESSHHLKEDVPIFTGGRMKKPWTISKVEGIGVRHQEKLPKSAVGSRGKGGALFFGQPEQDLSWANTESPVDPRGPGMTVLGTSPLERVSAFPWPLNLPLTCKVSELISHAAIFPGWMGK